MLGIILGSPVLEDISFIPCLLSSCLFQANSCLFTYFSALLVPQGPPRDATVWAARHSPVNLTLCQVALKLRRLVHICYLDSQDLKVSDTNIILNINLQIKYVWSCFKV